MPSSESYSSSSTSARVHTDTTGDILIYDINERVDVEAGARLLRSPRMLALKTDDPASWTAIRDTVGLARMLGGYVPVRYFMNETQDGFGRMKARVMAEGPQSCIPYVRMKKEVRAHLASAFYDDIDMVNCHPCILSQRLALDGIACPLLDRYVSDRDACIAEVMAACKVSRDIAKNLFVRLLYFGGVEGWAADYPDAAAYALPRWVHEFKAELRRCGEELVVSPEFAELKASHDRPLHDHERQPDRLSSIMAFYLQTKERECVQALVDAIHADEVSVGSIIYDGVLVQKPVSAEKLVRWSKAIRQKTGFAVNLAVKPFALDSGWSSDPATDPNDGWEEAWRGGGVMLSYDQMKIEWERHCFKIIDSGNFVREKRDSRSIYSKRMLQDSFEQVRYSVVDKICNGTKAGVKISKHPFVARWITDPAIREYEKLVFSPPPLEVAADTYNLWVGFAVERYNPGTRQVDTNSEAVRAYSDLISALCGRNEAVTSYLLDWLAQLFQRPAVKTGVAVLLTGEEGVGKNRFTDLLRDMVGPKDCFLQTASPSTTLYGRFTRLREGRMLIVINESSGSDNFAANDVIKDMITCDEFVSEGKNTNAYSIGCFSRFIFTTNNDNVLKVNPDSRRYFVIDVSSELKGNTEYFKRLSAFMEDAHGRYEFYRYLMGRNIDHVDWIRDRPVTEGLLQMIDQNMPFEQQFIKERIIQEFARSPRQNKPFVSRLDPLFKEFVQWGVEHRGLDVSRDGMNAKKFGVRMTKLVWTRTNTTGFKSITKGRSDVGISYTFDVHALAKEMVEKKWASAEEFECYRTSA